MIRPPLLAAALALYFGARFLLVRRRNRNVVRLRGGGTVKLLSSVALLNGSDGDLLALEYLSELPEPAADNLRTEARSLLQARVEKRRTGAQWALDSLEAMGREGTVTDRHLALTAAMLERQGTGHHQHQ